jgi:acetyl esterase/lipase
LRPRTSATPGDVCPSAVTTSMTDLLRLVGGLLLLALASMTALPAPHPVLWGASVAATEYGYWLAIAALLPIIPTRRQTGLGRIGALCSVCAIPLLVLPVYRARVVGSELQKTFDAEFGKERRERPPASGEPRPEPIVLQELVTPLTIPPVRFEERTFASHEGQTLTLDVYHPAYLHDAIPGVIVIHGGGWQRGDNSEFAALNAYLASRDYVVAAINYRLAPRWRFPAAAEDVKTAVAYLKEHASEFPLDPSRLTLLGRSEGGQLALLAAYTARDPSIRGVVSIYAPSDLTAAYAHPSPATLYDTRGLLERYVGGPPARAEKVYFAASPINFVTAASPPTLLVHGTRDQMIPADQSARLDDRLRDAGVKHVFAELPWATHGCDKSFGGPCGQITMFAVERFLDAVTIAQASDAPARGKHAKTVASRR